MKKTETTNLKWIGGVGLRLIGDLGVWLSGSVGGSVTSSLVGGDVEDRVGLAMVKQRGESLREWGWESFERRWDRGESLREWVESDTERDAVKIKEYKKNKQTYIILIQLRINF